MRLFLTLLLSVAVSSLAQGPAPQHLKGTVKERVDAAGYSYLRIATSTGEEWAAVPQGAFEVGKVVTVEVQAKMQNFESKTLQRKWPVITFGTVAGAPSVAAAEPAPGVDNPHARGLPKTTPATPGLEGSVQEKIDTSTYTYLRLKTAGGETWAAVPRAEVAVGAKVRIHNPQPMDGFKSPSLNRTFARIVFGTLGAP